MDLPPPGIMRWTAWQKAQIVRAIRDGSLTPAEVLTRYMLSEEELASWQNDFELGGIAGLQQKSLRRRRRRRHHE